MALTHAEEEELNLQRSLKDRRMRNIDLDKEVPEFKEMLEEWKDLVPVDLRTHHRMLRKRLLDLSDKLAVDEENQETGRQQDSVACDSQSDFVNKPAL